MDLYLLWDIRDPGDFDNDDHVDAVDYVSFGNCFTGPNPQEFVVETCRNVFDADDDGDIDFADFSQLQPLFGP